MHDVEQIKERLRQVFASQKFAVLSTNRAGESHANLVAFAATDDLRGLMFATNRMTRKYANLRENARIALLIDTRSNREADLRDAVAITASGTAEEVAERERDALLACYLGKHPELADFVNTPTCALILMNVSRYSFVSKFQEVIEWQVS